VEVNDRTHDMISDRTPTRFSCNKTTAAALAGYISFDPERRIQTPKVVAARRRRPSDWSRTVFALGLTQKSLPKNREKNGFWLFPDLNTQPIRPKTDSLVSFADCLCIPTEIVSGESFAGLARYRHRAANLPGGNTGRCGFIEGGRRGFLSPRAGNHVNRRKRGSRELRRAELRTLPPGGGNIIGRKHRRTHLAATRSPAAAAQSLTRAGSKVDEKCWFRGKGNWLAIAIHRNRAGVRPAPAGRRFKCAPRFQRPGTIDSELSATPKGAF